MKIWIAHSEDGETYAFRSEESMLNFIDKYIEDLEKIYEEYENQKFYRSDWFYWETLEVRD